ncbi:MAG: adenylate/guanylate cyclase domain-containing protein [Puniceicoccales bacterium]|jgi:adenylate cyclase|nr:adenylate/guanylate cyclase domain-containing protein [Puniceicoccales bacterium]
MTPKENLSKNVITPLITYRRLFFFILTGLVIAAHAILLLIPQGVDHLEIRSLESAYQRRNLIENVLGRRMVKIEDITILGFNHSFNPDNYQDLLDSEPALALLAKPIESREIEHRASLVSYDRALYAMILEKLAQAGADMIIFDFSFFYPNPGREEGDRMFAESINRWKHKVVLASEIKKEGLLTWITEPENFIPDDNPDEVLGYINITPDVRSSISFAINAYNRTALSSPSTADRNLSPDLFSLSARAAMKLGSPVPDSAKKYLINYAGPDGTFPMVPVQDIFTPSEWTNKFKDGAAFKNKIVFVGPYNELIYKDKFPTPVGSMFGVEIQANCLNNSLKNNWIREILPDYWALIATTGLGLLFWFLFTSPKTNKLNALFKILILAGIVGGWYVTHWICFSLYNLFFPAFSMPANIFLAVCFISLDFVRAQYERARIRNLFGAYLAPEVVNKLTEKGEEPELGGDMVRLTGYFSDVQAFSTLAEKLSPAQLVELMNQYFGAMTSSIEKYEGTLDKYIGDAMVAMFGAPLDMPDHAARACECALDMQANLEELRKKWAAYPAHWSYVARNMRMRIGMNTGPAIVGNIGSYRRFNYTMMGDTVNLASRCETGAKNIGAYIIVTQNTVDAANGVEERFIFRKLDLWRVKGRDAPCAIYELICRKQDLDETTKELLAKYAEALSLYFMQDWEQAHKKFIESAELEILQPGRDEEVLKNPSLVMAERCTRYLTTPPGNKWDGVYNWKEE